MTAACYFKITKKNYTRLHGVTTKNIGILINPRYKISDFIRPHAMTMQHTLDAPQGTAVAQWLRYCAINRKVAGSNPAGVSGIFHWHKILPIALWSWVDSASNRNEFQEYFLGVKAAGA